MKTLDTCWTTVLLFAGFTACSSSNDRAGGLPTLPTDSGELPDGGTSDAGSEAGTGGSDAGAGTDGGLDAYLGDGTTESPNLGTLPVVDVPYDGCLSPGAPAVTVAPPSIELGTGFIRMGAVGSRRWAFSQDTGVLMTFAPGGSDPSPLTAGPVALASQGDRLVGLLARNGSTDVQVYDAFASPEGAPIHVGATSDAWSIAAGPSHVLALWRDAGAIAGAVVSDAGTAPVNLGPGSGGEGPCQTAAVWNGDSFSVVWSRRLHNGTSKTSWIRIKTDGTWDFAKHLVESTGTHYLTDLAVTPMGLALLMVEGKSGDAAVLVRTDAWGERIGPGYRLERTSYPWTLGVNGDKLAVAGSLDDGRGAVRVFGVTGAPMAPWVCVDDSLPSSGFYAQAAVMGEGTGWAILALQTDGSVVLRQTDESGLGAP